MKKIVIFTMMLTLTVLSVNAQVFKVSAAAHGITSDAVPIEAGHTWGDIDGLIEISNPFFTDHKVVDCQNNNYYKVIIDDNEIATSDGVQGSDNPKDEDGGNPALTLKPVVSGAVIQIDAYENGWVYIVAKLLTNKQYMVFKDGVPMGYKIAMENTDERVKDGVLNLEIKGEGENNYIPEGRQIQWVIREYTGDLEAASAGNGLGVFYFPVAEGCTYLAHATGSKISWSGVYFSETEAESVLVKGDGISKIIVDNPNPSPAPSSNYDIWSLAGDPELFGSDWVLTDKKNKMKTTDGVNYTRKKSGVSLEKGTYEYRVAKDYAWEIAYPADKAKLVIEENATYTVTFTFNAETHELSATAEKTDGIFYNFIPKGKVAEVIQKPSGKYTGYIIIPETVMHEGVEYNVTKIADNAFSGCTGLTSVTIANSVTSIGQYAFQSCSGLTSVTKPNSVTSIGGFAFSYCSALTSITIPNNVTSIRNYAFYGCTGLKSVIIPNSVTSIGESAFLGCRGLTSVTIPSGVTTICQSAFSGCNGLTSVTIPNSVTSIGNSAFYGCTGLTSVTIPNNVTTIGNSVFEYCTGLTSITIPNSVTSIGNSAFSGCSGLTSFTIPNSVTSIGNSAFFNCSGLKSVIIPNNLTSIGESAFSGCSGLTSVTIPTGVTSISPSAFSGCSGLISVTIPNSVTSIGNSAFYNCSGLTTVTIGENVSSIFSAAFSKCSNLTDVYCSAENVPNTIANVFNSSYIEYATLHVPAALMNNYNNAEPWKNFKEIVALEGGDIPEMQKCATPTIAFDNGKITFSCETEGAEFISTITPAEINKKYDSEIVISNTYKVTVYATKVGFINSDKATIEIQASSSILGDIDGNGVVNVADHVKLSSIIMEQSE